MRSRGQQNAECDVPGSQKRAPFGCECAGTSEIPAHSCLHAGGEVLYHRASPIPVIRSPFPRPFAFLLILAACCSCSALAAEIDRIWLTHAGADSSTLVVNWATETSSDSVVEYGKTPEVTEGVRKGEEGTLHHVEVPLPSDGSFYYRVRSGENASRVCQIIDRSPDEFRIVLIGNAGYAKAPWGEAIVKEHPHLLLSAGDNVAALHRDGKPTQPDDVTAYLQLVDRHRELFSTTPFLPALGNHDREIRSWGPKPPAEPVYDIEATAFRKFFALPGDEWIWTFTIPQFGVRLAALDLNHLSDFGTTWQTCHLFQRNSEQFAWFQKLTEASAEPFLVTIYNEQNSRVRNLEGGEWGRMIRKGSLALSGFGYFGERAEVDGVSFYNTSVNGTGSRYPDPKSAALHGADNYLLLTFRAGGKELIVEMKDLKGGVLDRKTFAPRPAAAK